MSIQHQDRSHQQADLDEDLEGADQDNAQLTVTVQLGLQTLSERKQAVDAQVGYSCHLFPALCLLQQKF